MMPPEAAAARGKQKAALAGILHEKATDPTLGRLTSVLSKHQASFNEHQKAVVYLAAKEYKRKASVTKELAQQAAELESAAMQAWVEARKESDFSKFEPFLEQWVDLSRRKAAMIDPKRPAYDVLLEEFEPGMTAARIDEVFAEMKAGLIPLLEELRRGKKPASTFLSASISKEKQSELSRKVSHDMGFDFSKGRMDVSVHPFTSNSHPTDVRITSRYKEEDMREGMMATIHETGHALYEQGRNLGYDGLPVNAALSMGVHESQSLLWERMVALSEPCMPYLLSKILETMPELKGPEATPRALHARLNEITEPSLIRVESDEVTYPLHIVIRYEIERALIEGTLQVKDIPAEWNKKMQQYLGYQPPDDAKGCLQDVHWSAGAIGYFPTYTLGAMYACQIFRKAQLDIEGLDAQISKGDFSRLKAWLNRNIHEKGSLYKSADELLTQVTGEPLNVSIFLDYLGKKYRALYAIN